MVVPWGRLGRGVWAGIAVVVLVWGERMGVGREVRVGVLVGEGLAVGRRGLGFRGWWMLGMGLRG